MIALIAFAPGKRTFARQNAAMAEKMTWHTVTDTVTKILLNT